MELVDVSKNIGNLPCLDCKFWIDFPSSIYCQGCARIYTDHYQPQEKGIEIEIDITSQLKL